MDTWSWLGVVTIGAAGVVWAINYRRYRRSLASQAIIPGLVVGFGSLGLLGVLIGWVGASRAYGGPDTLFRDHLPALVVAGLATLALAALGGRGLQAIRELGWLLCAVFLADVVAALIVVVVFGEITLADLPRAIITETVLGMQIVAVGVGAFVGYASRSRRAKTAESRRDIPAR